MKPGITHLVLPDLPCEEFFRVSKDAGYECVELAMRPTGELTPQTADTDLRRIVESAKRIGVTPTSMCHSHITGNLLDSGDLYGEGIRQVDLRFGKNFRFSRKRLNVGVDVYNLFNSDGATSYNNTYTAWRDPATGTWYQGLGPEGGRDNPATTAVEVQNWGQVNGVMSPRFLRFQIQFDF